ncbi:MAG: DnaB-like helicase C-terminal domain-containing protein [Dehalococcoidia bacterium]|nr:DnaB-like helicase C-terminal domain-containing protein [Dehalococcoidia bacterium]
MKTYKASDEFTDAELELGLAAAVAADPDLYWAVRDLVADGAFAVHSDLWHQIAEAVESERQPLPVVHKVIKDGVEIEEPVSSLPDPEAAARRLADLYQRRLLAEVHQDQMQRLRSEESADVLITELEARLIEVSQAVRETRQGTLLWGSDLLGQVVGQAEAAQKRKEETGSPISGLSTGFGRLDEHLNGLNQGVYVLAAPPGYGKTSLVLQICGYVAEHTPVVYVTFENSPTNLVLKSVCRLAHIVPGDVERGRVDLTAFKTGADLFKVVASRLAFVEGSTRTTPAMLRGKALQAMHHHQSSRCLIAIDYLQRMAHQEGLQNMRENVGFLTLQLRELSHRLQSPILAISSQSRQGYERGKTNPYLETLKESGELEYSADVVMFIQETEEISCTPVARNYNLKVVKNRYGEAGVDVLFTFKPAFGEFRETTKP